MAGAETDPASSKNVLVRLLVNHWTVNPVLKSAAQQERETYLFLYWKLIPFNRWMLFFSAFVIQFCCGSLYAWSNFNAPIDVLIYGTKTANKAPNTFYMTVGMLGMTAMIMGPWVERNGPRRAVLLGSAMFGCGQGVAAFSLLRKSIVGVYIGYGILGGFGLGVTFISPISPLQKFFPDYRGLASGFSVAGFGAGSIVWSKLYLPLTDAVHLPQTFAILGAILAGTMLMSGILMRTPPNNFAAGGLQMNGEKAVQVENDNDKISRALSEQLEGTFTQSLDYLESGRERESRAKSAPDSAKSEWTVVKMSLIQSIFTPEFGFMYLVFFANQVFGLVVLSRLANMAQDLFGQTRSEGTNIVSINGIFDLVGRLVLSMTSDFLIKTFNVRPPFSRKCVFAFTLVTQVIIVAILPQIISTKNYGGFRAAIWTMTFVYGGGIGTIACFLTDMFGPYNIGALHGIILSAWAGGGVGGGLVFTHLFDLHKPAALPAGQTYPPGAFDDAYTSNFNWILGALVLGLIVLFLIRTNPIDRQAPGWSYSVFGKKIVLIKASNAVEAANL